MSRKRPQAYAGFYRGSYLRSSYEYLYAVYLTKKKINWVSEPEAFLLPNGKTYKPDFYLPDTNTYVEVKGEYTYEKDIKKVEALRGMGKKVKVVVLDDLKLMYEELGLSYTRFIAKWKRKSQLSGDKARATGKRNPRYGILLSEESKKVTSEKAKERWSNPEYAKRMKKAFKNRDYSKMEGPRAARVTVKCQGCGEEMIQTEASKRLYCSNECSGMNTSVFAREAKAKKAKARRQIIKEVVDDWCDRNVERIKACEYNKITPGLKPLLDELESMGYVDFRTICIAVIGRHGRKDLLDYMKNRVQNIVRTNGNAEPLEAEDKEPLR